MTLPKVVILTNSNIASDGRGLYSGELLFSVQIPEQDPCDGLVQKRCNAITSSDGLVQKRCNSIAEAMELHIFCAKPSEACSLCQHLYALFTMEADSSYLKSLWIIEVWSVWQTVYAVDRMLLYCLLPKP